MSFQNYWMAKGTEYLPDGEMAYDNSSRIEPKRSHQWFMDGTEAELFPNKKQAVEVPSHNSFPGFLNPNVSPWANASNFPPVTGQFTGRLFDPEASRTIDFDDRNIPSVGTGNINMGRKVIEDQFGNDSSFGLSISHTLEDPRLGLNYGGIRKVKVSQVKDSENFMSVSLGHAYNRGDNSTMSTPYAYVKADDNTTSMGLSFNRGNDNIISTGNAYNSTVSTPHAYGKADNSAISMGLSFNRGNDNIGPTGDTYNSTMSTPHAYGKADDNTISMGLSFNRGNDNIIPTGGAYNSTISARYVKADDNTISMGLSFNRVNDNIISMADAYNRVDNNFISIGQTYSKGEEDSTISLGLPYKENHNAISMGRSFNKGEDNITSMGQTFNNEDVNSISLCNSFKDNSTMSVSQTFSKGDNSFPSSQTFNKGDGKTISMGNSYNKVDDSAISTGHTYNKVENNALSLGQSFGKGEGNIISFGGFQEDDDINSSERLMCSYDLLMGQSSAQRPESLSEEGLVESNVDVIVSAAKVTSTVSKTASKEDQKGSKKPSNNFPSNVRSLLSTAMLDGVPVKYIAWSREKELHGIIKGSGYLCGCQSCNFSKVINAYEFERHAGCKTKHPNNHIYFENGKTIYGIVQELKNTPQNLLFEVIQTITGSPINQKSFRIWKESFMAATRELQRIYGKDEGKKLS
ncbi:uncharacterized protein LOC130784030 isoform X1 [Actinidia eriantha]|uniref:uncharacterized protein LOC130784030 isoform X1 n=2 Tax=Actinidia eriantha TaxID=165200 RepID=UPI002588863A|nr:uncharacterized protein LOC130784030 isoform X1 [Actinidia eriantha]XP_057499852.1 uncharacterized protein LOC130784030 isoform X1 [Actinidia eriantha]